MMDKQNDLIAKSLKIKSQNLTVSTHNTKIHSGLLEFETRYAEKQRQSADIKALKEFRPVRPNGHNVEPNKYQLEAVALRQMVHERLKNGYTLPFTKEIAGRWHAPFTEQGLRSEDNPILKLFVSLIPAGGKARASDDKATLNVQSRSKLLTLDYPYIELNKVFLGAIRVDCDGVFKSPTHLLHELELLVKAGEIPCLPHIIVGDLMDGGTYRRPHLIFMLPPGSAVWKTEDKRCRSSIIRLFIGVHNGLTKAMIEIGADPAVPATTMRMKNPLSPIWHTVTPNCYHMPTLSEYADWVDTRTNREVLVRRAASVQSKMGITASNILFNSLRKYAANLLIEWHFNTDIRIKGSRAALADHLHLALENYAKETGLDDLHAASVIAKVSDYLSLTFDPQKLQNRKNRGQILHVVDDMKSVKERQKAGSTYSNNIRKQQSLDKLVSAYREAQEQSKELSLEQLASKAGVSRTTAYRHFEACKQICTIGCIDKKESNPSLINKIALISMTTEERKNKDNMKTNNVRVKRDNDMVFMNDSEYTLTLKSQG